MALDWQKFVTEPEPGIIEFTMKPEHVKLLRSAKIEWNEENFGVPTFNSARPYGSSLIFKSMTDVLEIPYEKTDAFYANLTQLHQETAVALQVILKTGKFKSGCYRADKFTQNWHEYRENNGRKPRINKGTSQGELDLGQYPELDRPTCLWYSI